MSSDSEDWQAKHQKRLSEAFNKACETFPELKTGNAQPLGMGAFGLVIEHDDDTVTKILFRPNKEWGDYAQRSFENEMQALRILTGNPIEGVTTPVLIGEPDITDDSEDYLGRYRMTRIKGECYGLHMPAEELAPEKLDKIHKSAGKALAIFHREAKGRFDEMKGQKGQEGNKVEQVDALSDEENAALEKANDYLQANIKGGIIHGDFHGGNILFDENLDVAAILDFANVGYTPNIMIDFSNINEAHREAFVSAYEQESGETLDRQLMTVTTLALCTSYVNRLEKWEPKDDDPERDKNIERNNEAKDRMYKEIKEHLGKIPQITGMQP